MKVAITAEEAGLESRFDTRFGRAAYFIVYDFDKDSWEFYANTQNFEAAQGAGIQAAQTVERLGASAVITGHVGPKAFKVLSASGIKIFTASAATVQDAVSAFKQGQLVEIQAPDVEGHWV